MKNIEALVTDLETSKQLQEAGIDFGATAFVWQITIWEKDKPNQYELILRKDANKNLMRYNIPAFTAGELMQVLPFRMHAYTDYLGDKHFTNLCLIKRLGVKYIAGYDKEGSWFEGFNAKDALAKLCLWCSNF
jgi:hypothetical protein